MLSRVTSFYFILILSTPQHFLGEVETRKHFPLTKMGKRLVVLRLSHVIEHFSQSPCVLGVGGHENGIRGRRLLVNLDGHWHQFVCFVQIEQSNWRDHLQKIRTF
jgi:hypothetical protein